MSEQGVERTIGGVRYFVGYLPPRKQGHLALEIAQAVGPVVLSLKTDSDVRSAMLGLSEPLYDKLVNEFEKVSSADGVPLTGKFDAHFRGPGGFERQTAFLMFALRVNFFPSLSAFADTAALFSAETL